MQSLYRRHRPRSFDAVVGQESVVRTLRNAIELDKVHHAYLFVGSRGTGKTSMAKLLACALNAEGGARVDFDPESRTAKAIMAGSSLDVVEMDAASNNSVDDIRELRENVGLAPMGGAKRVYILDEAHMLSQAAWNAFLKTLEEPPGHVVFVLATTEAHKVPATIVDRCHRFDFQRPSLEQIAGVLRRVADEEGITVPDPAVGMIARKASGSFRDALGTLEQLVTYGGSEIALDDVLATLGVADAELILETADTLAAGDPRGALNAVVKLTDSGRDEAQFMRDLAAHLRHLYVIQAVGEVPESFAVTAEHTGRLTAQAERIPQAEVLRAIDLLAAALAAVKDGSEPRLQLEVALLKATQPRADQSLQALLHRIDRLEAQLAAAGAGGPAAPVEPPPRVAAPPAQPPAEPAARSQEPSAQPAPEHPTASSPAGAEDSWGSTPNDPPRAEQAAPAATAVAVEEPVPPPAAPDPAAAEPAPPPTQTPAEPSPAAASVPPQPPAAESRADDSWGSTPNDPPAAAQAPPPPAAHVPAPEAATGLDIDRVAALWPAVADAVREQNAMVAALLAEAVPTAIDGEGRLTVQFPADAAFSKKKAEANRELIAGALRSLGGHSVAVAFELGGVREDSGPATLTADELADRLMRDFAAEEIFETDEPESED
ncbi:MAG: DNA polymerase III subunit gamma/tau [Solirubrobacterales bacterium]|nr:DNA polymerase III subunit gamma/tau [Solirubrobacterales bacterium]